MRNPWDEEIERNKEQIKNVFSQFKRKTNFNFGNGKSNNSGFLMIIIALIIIWLGSGFYTVKPDEQASVLRFGKCHRNATPGLNYHLPSPIEDVIILSVTNIRRIDIGANSGNNSSESSENLMLTGDSNLANITFTVLWKIKPDGINDFLFNARSPELAIRAYAESVMRSEVGKNQIMYVQTEGRAEIASKVKEELQKLLDEYKTGVEIIQVNLQNVEPPVSVIDSFRDVERAQADQQRSVNEADAYKRNVQANARGEAAEILNNAEANKQSLIAEASGVASRFLSVYNQYKLAKGIIRKRIYFETMSNIIKNSTVTILDENNGILPHTNIGSTGDLK